MNFHGLSYHPLYGTWYRMTQRCSNPYDPAYPNYGGRGIRVHDEWMAPAPYIAYVEAELGDKPSRLHSIDRIDNDGPYEPGNIKWSTRSEQNTNQRQRVLRGYPLGASGARGIRFVARTGRYQARIARGGKDITVGTFATLEEAVVAREAAL